MNSLGFLGETVSLLGEIPMFSQTSGPGLTGFRWREALKRQGWTAKEVGVTTVDPMWDSPPSWQGR